MPKAKRDRGGGGRARTPAESARDYLRAAAGGLLVGLPLLVTAEVWDAGATLPASKLLALLGAAFAIVVGFNALAGFRRERNHLELLVDSVESFGIAVVVAALALAVLGRLDLALGPGVIVGRIALETIPVAFGTSLAATVLGDEGSSSGGEGEGRGPTGARPVGSLGRLLVAAAGSLYFALNVAPTEEIRRLGAEADAPLLLLVVAVSLAMSLGIVFHAEFRGGRGGIRPGGPLETPVGETVVAYAISLAVSMGLLWSFGLVDGAGPSAVVAMTVMLGFVAAFGGAAGRLLVGGATGSA